jgi:hypothetical protein
VALARLKFALNSLKKHLVCKYLSNITFIDNELINNSRISNIFWIDASSKDSIELGLMQIGQDSQEAKQSVRSVLEWISQRTSWLMVYDGADGHYQIVEKYLPPGNRGNILITSRSLGLRRITLDSLQILDMAEEEASLLLLKSARLDGMSEKNSYLARKLALELGGIPIALDQAGAYMLITQCGIADYLELYTNLSHPVTNPLPRTHASHMFDESSLVTPHVDKDTLYPTSCRTHVL